MMDTELSGREVLLMKCIWEREGDVSIQDVQNDAKEKFDWDAKRSTVRTFLTSMEAKQYIKTERRGRFTYIVPMVTEEAYREDQTRKMIDFWYDGSKGILIKALAKDDITEEGAAHLMEVLDELSDD
jgi:BlaI family penicillinase repressor